MVEKWKKMKKETVGHELAIYTHGIFKSGKGPIQQNSRIAKPDKGHALDIPKTHDSGTNAELEVLEKTPLLEWFAEEYKKFGCTLEFVTNRSQEGSQFCRGFGGIGGILIVTTHDSCQCRKMGPRASSMALNEK
ncbi:eukaryotic peptide chain release factor subunit 1-2 [Tanacetum coccineum]